MGQVVTLIEEVEEEVMVMCDCGVLVLFPLSVRLCKFFFFFFFFISFFSRAIIFILIM